jgi:hypothetical protein
MASLEDLPYEILHNIVLYVLCPRQSACFNPVDSGVPPSAQTDFLSHGGKDLQATWSAIEPHYLTALDRSFLFENGNLHCRKVLNALALTNRKLSQLATPFLFRWVTVRDLIGQGCKIEWPVRWLLLDMTRDPTLASYVQCLCLDLPREICNEKRRATYGEEDICDEAQLNDSTSHLKGIFTTAQYVRYYTALVDILPNLKTLVLHSDKFLNNNEPELEQATAQILASPNLSNLLALSIVGSRSYRHVSHHFDALRVLAKLTTLTTLHFKNLFLLSFEMPLYSRPELRLLHISVSRLVLDSVYMSEPDLRMLLDCFMGLQHFRFSKPAQPTWYSYTQVTVLGIERCLHTHRRTLKSIYLGEETGRKGDCRLEGDLVRFFPSFTALEHLHLSLGVFSPGQSLAKPFPKNLKRLTLLLYDVCDLSAMRHCATYVFGEKAKGAVDLDVLCLEFHERKTTINVVSYGISATKIAFAKTINRLTEEGDSVDIKFEVSMDEASSNFLVTY